jgi:hypothetical protein
MAAGVDVVELHRNAHAIAAPPYATLDHVVDPEFLGDLLQMDGLALVN